MILLTKAVRAMWSSKKAYIACIMLITIGVFIHNIMGIMIAVFGSAIDRYYEEYRLGDVFAKLRAIPASVLPDLERIEGVEEVNGRYVYDARVMIGESEKFITLRITSVDPTYTGMPVGGVKLSGAFGSASDLAVGQGFLDSWNLKTGDTLRVIIERREYDLTLCGTAESPEYVYPMKDAASILTDPETFGFAYMPQDGLWALVNQNGIYNDVCLQLDEATAFDSVKSPLEDELSKYGLLALFPRKDHSSVSIVDMEFSTIATMSTAMPVVFMAMAMVVLYLMLKRIIEQERTQIGVLKAFGYSNNTILAHYTLYGAVTGAAGGVLGALMAVGASGTYIDLFRTYFLVPINSYNAPPLLLLRGLGIAVGAGVLGGYFGARRSLKLEPADAMRPEAPKLVTAGFLDRFPFLQAPFNTGGRMALRGIARNKMRSAVIVIGVMFSFALMTFTGAMSSIVDSMMLNMFTKSQRFDAKMTFVNPLPYEAAREAAYRIDGVTLAEGILEMPVELKNRHLSTGVNIIGLDAGSMLYKVYDNKKEENCAPPSDGILLNDALAMKLDAKKGDILYLSSPLLEEDIKLAVSGVAEQNTSIAAYMEISALSELFHLSKTATAAIVKTDDPVSLKQMSDEAKNLSDVQDNKTMYNSYLNFMAPYTSLYFIMWLLSGLVAFAIIYNTSTISLSERKREYATLRVIGMQVKEVGAIMGFEYWVLCVIGMLLGIPFNAFLRQMLSGVFASDTFTFPTTVPPFAYASAALGCMLAVFFANRSAVRQIKKFDMVEVLKERE